jgi:hypothetical protein
MSTLPASAPAQSLPAGFSSQSEVEAFQRLFRAAYEGARSRREYKTPSSCEAMLGGFSLDTKSSDESKVYFAVL